MLCDAHPPQLRQGLPLAPRRLGATSLGAFWHAQSARRGATWAGFAMWKQWEKKQWIVWVDHHFLCQHFLGIHNPYFQRHGCFFNVGLWFTKTWIVQTTWRWLHVFPTKVRSTNELIMVDPRTYGSYVMLYPPALTLIWMWPPQVSLFITFYNPINNYRYHLYPP